ncbi:unnamed protein product [Schistocephalus solidus]|uniref:SH3 domain-containing protein n=1 Tax=Schistocephalus solidus TaxID=70667 RepID=A0A183SCE4_SCHSO|nr:unnamed protein product [Schistocephalus solidus]
MCPRSSAVLAVANLMVHPHPPPPLPPRQFLAHHHVLSTDLYAQLGKKEVEDLLKKGAYGALMEDDKAGDEFCEEDIDQILQSRSHVIQLEQGEKNSTFSKVSAPSCVLMPRLQCLSLTASNVH